ncbi:extracellular metalloproteinase 1 [Batrachochytrium salamandrivorans]|nr:extracellular metalloproteinase 1 [Batrachochytrium salamandrivorans]
MSVLPTTKQLPMLRMAKSLPSHRPLVQLRHFPKGILQYLKPKPHWTLKGRLPTASAQLGIPVYSEFEHALEYVEQPDGKIAYAYKLQLRNNPVTKWVEASYKAIPLPRRDANEGFSTVSNPEFVGSSPSGWTGGKATEGNNVITSTPSGKTTPSTSDGVFDSQFNSIEAPDTDANLAAAAVNLFYISNVMHDISYQYGFTESAGNFQTNNFGKGGQGNDAVAVNVLNPSKSNDATFFTPPDGQPGVMNMYRFTSSTPNRNPGFDNGVVSTSIHMVSPAVLLADLPLSRCLNKF